MSSFDYLDLHPFVRSVAVDKGRGVVLGGALGDALGLYTEFLSRELAHKSYPNGIKLGRTPLRPDSHRDKFTLGLWTDDTDHSLLLVLSYLHYYGQHHSGPPTTTLINDFAARLASWCEQGLLALSRLPIGLGRTIASVALNPNFLAGPQALAREKWNKVVMGEKPASNGSIMRTHPVGVMAVGCATEEEAFMLAAEVSTTTHADPRCTLACCAVVVVLRGIIRGDILNEQHLDDALMRAPAWIKGIPRFASPGDENVKEDEYKWLHLEEFEKYTSGEATLESLHLDDAMKIGYVYKCLGAGLVTLRAAMRETVVHSDTFTRHMTALIMEGGDADTNGSVAGALLGAWLGASHLPWVWIQDMMDSKWLVEKNQRFIAAVGLHDAEGDAEWDANPLDKDSDIYGGRQPLTEQERKEREQNLLFAILGKEKRRQYDEAQKQKPRGLFGSFR